MLGASPDFVGSAFGIAVRRSGRAPCSRGIDSFFLRFDFRSKTVAANENHCK